MNRPRYEVLIHPDATDEDTLSKLPKQYHDCKITVMDRHELNRIKSLIAPHSTDEQFWPKDMIYITDTFWKCRNERIKMRLKEG